MTTPGIENRVSSKINEGIADLQSLYKRSRRSFSDEPSPATYVP